MRRLVHARVIRATWHDEHDWFISRNFKLQRNIVYYNTYEKYIYVYLLTHVWVLVRILQKNKDHSSTRAYFVHNIKPVYYQYGWMYRIDE